MPGENFWLYTWEVLRAVYMAFVTVFVILCFSFLILPERNKGINRKKKESPGSRKKKLKRITLSPGGGNFCLLYIPFPMEQELFVKGRDGQGFYSKNSKKQVRKLYSQLAVKSPRKCDCSILPAFIRKQEKQITTEDMCCGRVTENMV